MTLHGPDSTLLTEHEYALLRFVMVSLCFTYQTSPRLVMSAGKGARNAFYARRALAVAGRELQLSWWKIAQFMGVAHSTICGHFKEAMHEQIAVGIAAANEARNALGAE